MLIEPLPEHLTAPGVALRLAGLSGLVWLDGDGEHALGRHSFVGADPVAVECVPAGNPAPLAAFDRMTLPSAMDAGGPLAPAEVPAWIGFVGYDAHFGDRRARAHGPVPTLWFGRYDALCVFDALTGAAHLVADDAAARDRMLARLAGAPGRPRARVGTVRVPDPHRHGVAIGKALEHIAAGDIYQVNLARRFSAHYDGDPLSLWLAMRRASPVPLGAYVDTGAEAVLCRSMERFVRFADDVLETRPIKGTLASDKDPLRLRADPKEQAEHTMIVDLMRNDLGRVARTGTVEVSDVMQVEPFANLFHLVSTVRCHVRAGTTRRDVLEATFPPGSVTGAPKIRACEIIEALEPGPRGVYTGAVGFVDRAGGMSLSVAIRTAVVRAGRADYWAGGGLVEASDARREVMETDLKARVFLDALDALRADAPIVALSDAV